MNKDGTWDYGREAEGLRKDADSMRELSNEFAAQAVQLGGIQRLDGQKPAEPEERATKPQGRDFT